MGSHVSKASHRPHRRAASGSSSGSESRRYARTGGQKTEERWASQPAAPSPAAHGLAEGGQRQSGGQSSESSGSGPGAADPSLDDDAPELTMAPATIPCQYRTGKTLGSGTYAIVKEAVHIKTGKYYACKVINKKLMEGREYM
ncbi:hypothetical protein OH76DRAFT_1424078, partial [Lentinus brumalis]